MPSTSKTSVGAEHYDRITKVWEKWVMGPELHFGYFERPDQPLDEATAAMTALLAKRSQLQPGLRVLDVGCGVGTQSMRLAEEYGCKVTGISTSKVGVKLANDRAKKRGLAHKATFKVADAMKNKLRKETYDRVWALESIHVMPDKAAVFSECFRVLKPGGLFVLCDVINWGPENARELHQRMCAAGGHSEEVAARMYEAMQTIQRRAWGSDGSAPVEMYKRELFDAGFVAVQTDDISAQTRPTIEAWCKNVHDNTDAIAKAVGERYVEDWFFAALQMSAGWGTSVGYVLMLARKP